MTKKQFFEKALRILRILNTLMTLMNWIFVSIQPLFTISLSPSICWGFGSFKGNWILLFLYVFNLIPPE